MHRKFPFIKQLDAMQCGIAAMAMICRHFGMDYSSEQLGELCIASREGVSLKGLGDMARTLGLETKAVKATTVQLADCPLPCILHWKQNHFVVLYKVTTRHADQRRWHIADPAKGRYTFSDREFASCWLSTDTPDGPKGIALLLAPGPEWGRVKPEPCGRRRSLGFLTAYLRQYSRYLTQIAAGLALGCILQLLLPFLTQAIVDHGIHNADIRLIWLILLGELMIVAGRTATDFIRRWLLMHISMRINISLVSDFFIKLLKLPMSYFDTKLMGDLLQRMNDHSRVQSFLTSQTLGILFTTLSFGVFGVVLFIYDPLIFCVFIAGSIVYGAWIALFLRRRKVLDYELFEQQAIDSNKTYQFITSMQEIKLQRCERRRRWEWEDVQADLFTVRMKILRLEQAQEAGSIFINEVKNILITVMAANAVIDGTVTLGAMLAIQYIVGQLNSPVEQMMGFIQSLQDVRISLERINEVHCGRNEDTPLRTVTVLPTCHDIRLHGVGFSYDPHSPVRTLDDVTFTIPAGKVTAIVGASGSGKTTLIKLMLGFYPPSVGTITIGGTDIRSVSLPWWRSKCGAVMQDGVIFSESIARNIAVDDGPVDMARLHEAASIACIHDHIMQLPLRYDTIIGRDGSGLSQGQKQRILIARAVYKNPDFIFLDEATNSLDAHNEKLIVANLEQFYRGRTVIIVAHRLSTVRNAHQIIVLGDGGKVIETGTHSTLTAARGAYYHLVRNQLELGT